MKTQVLLPLLVLLTFTSLATAQSQVPTELALRLLYYGSGSPADNILLVAELPPSLRDQPLPDGATVLGSLILFDGTTRAELDAPQAPAELLTFYNAALPARGWRLVDPNANPSYPDVFRPAAQLEGVFGCTDTDEPQISFVERGDHSELSFMRSSQSDYTYCNPEKLAGGLEDDH